MGNIEEEEEEEEEEGINIAPVRALLLEASKNGVSGFSRKDIPSHTLPAHLCRSVRFQSSGLSCLTVSKALLGYH